MKRFINTKLVVDIASDRILSRQGFEYEGPTAEAVTGTTPVKIAECANVMGGKLEIWTSLVTTGAIAAATQEIETFAVTGARAGDLCWANVEAPLANLNCQGAKVTASDVVSVYLGNNFGVTTALATSAPVVTIFVLKRSVGS
jgi:hypothetical protein